MLRKLQQLREKEQGFTIIEVLIVLAIAALIMVIVLIAIPQLQRNQRNTARKEIVGRIATEIGSYSGNNNGKIPVAATGDTTGNFGSAITQANSFYGKYVPDTGIDDPTTGSPMAPDTVAASTTVIDAVTGATPVPAVNLPTANGEVGYYPKAKCNGEALTFTGNARDYAVMTFLEGGALYCVGSQ